MACGPAASNNQQDTSGGESHKPSETKTLMPDPEKPPIEVKPTAVAPATKTPQKPVPTDTPEEQPSQTTSSETGPSEAVTSTGALDAEVCKSYNGHDPSPESKALGSSSFLFRDCIEALNQDMKELCDLDELSSTADSFWGHEDQICLRNYLDGVREYAFRMWFSHGCLGTGVPTSSELLNCRAALVQRDRRETEAALPVMASLLSAIEDSAEVSLAEKNAWACLEAMGEKTLAFDIDIIDTNRLLFWLSWSVQPDQIEELAYLDQERRAKVDRRLELVDECAARAGVYEAHYDVFMSKIRRNLEEQPELIEIWVRNGWIDGLKEFGPSSLRPFGDKE